MRHLVTGGRRPGVLMVTGAYWPELSGGGLQCRTMIHALRGEMPFQVLTTCTDRRLPAWDEIEGIPVRRVLVDVMRPHTKVAALLAVVSFFLRRHRSFGVVHLHGFSRKSALVVLLALAFGKRIVLTLHTAEQDEPAGVRRQGRLAYWCYRQAHLYLAISEGLAARCLAGGLPADRLRVAPNGVDTGRFHPAAPAARVVACQALGLETDRRWILFVGLFTPDKCPDVLFDAWLGLGAARKGTGLLMVGATESAYHEVDAGIARDIRRRAADAGVGDLVRFTGPLPDVERAFHAADVFAMPSAREAFGMVLVEAMACGLPVVATRIDGVTDTIVDDGVTGVLVAVRDKGALAGALRRLLDEESPGGVMGARARAAVVSRYGLAAARERWMNAYDDVRG